ncbi:helix-turn-helix transcriptional regulator [Denitrobaculum tricleocarpae]|uniref:Helix-turn-helix transcriptional regulator n=2 Tax=Denitrobaculum tricleocarpae TaxID=2591009 RepID=A0A545TR34_9PROT|nr:helix-turn-helix transcriptional regulator [Denitrobaculum tricleocarpae]
MIRGGTMLNSLLRETSDGTLAALLSAFYKAVETPSTWSPAVKSVMSTCRASVGLIVSHDFDSGAGRIEHAENLSELLVRQYSEPGAPANAWFRDERFFRNTDTVVSGEEILPFEQLRDSRFYRDWLQPAGVHHCAWGVLARKDKRLICAGFGRPQAEGPFEAGDLALIEQVMPHFRRIIQVHELLGTSNFSQQILMEMLGALSVGVALLDGHGRVMEANAMAVSWLSKEQNDSHRKNGSAVTLDRFKPSLQAFLKSAGNGAEGRKMSVMRSEGPEPVTLILIPLCRESVIDEENGAGSILIISDPEYRCRIREDQLVKFYEFTPTEAKLARLLSNGYRLDEAAESMGIKYQTVRTHLKRIFSKTGIDRQSELVRLILTGPASFRLPEARREGCFDLHFDERGVVRSRPHGEA